MFYLLLYLNLTCNFNLHFYSQNETTTKLEATRINFYVRIQRLQNKNFEDVTQVLKEKPIAIVSPQSPATVEQDECDHTPKCPAASIKGRPNLFMIVGVYCCAAFVYLEFLVLAVTLNASTTPPGLLFLVSSLAYIGYIVFKVSNFGYKNYIVCVANFAEIY